MATLALSSAIEQLTVPSSPLRHIDGNLIVDKYGKLGAIYRIFTVSYPFLPLDEKLAIYGVMKSLPNTLKSGFSLKRVSRMYPSDQYINQAMMVFDERVGNRGRWEKYLNAHLERLEGLAPHIPEVYLIVELPVETTTVESKERPPGSRRTKRGMWEGIRGEMGKLEKVFGVQRKMPLTRSAFVAAQDVEADRLGVLRDKFGTSGVQRATTHEIQWLLRRQMCRGIGEPVIDRYWAPDAIEIHTATDVEYEPVTALLEQCYRGEMYEARDYLRIVSDAGVSYQTMVVMGSLPEMTSFPGDRAELLFAPMERLTFPVDCVLHLDFASNRKALKNADKKILEHRAVAVEEQKYDDGGVSPETVKQYSDAQDYKSYLGQEHHPPEMRGKPLFALGAESYELLEQRFRQLQEEFGDIQLYRPAWSQPELFYEHSLRIGAGVHDFDDVINVEQFGGMASIATHQVGSTYGPYIGHTTTTRRPVKFDVTEAARAEEPTAIFGCGRLGSGKTVGFETLCVLAHAAGSFVLTVDPKPDHGFHKIPDLQDSLHKIEFSSDEEFHGSLDPMHMPPKQMREGITLTYLCELLNTDRRDPRCKSSLMLAIHEAVQGEEWSLDSVVERLAGSGKTVAEELAEELATISRFGLASLAFGKGGASDEILRTDRSFVTIRTPGLTLPESSVARENYGEGERLSVATMGLIFGFAMRMMHERRDIHKTLFFDEVHAFSGSSEGAAALERGVRMGRALNTTVMLASQRPSDLQRLRHLISLLFIYPLSSIDDAKDAIGMLGLDRKDEKLARRIYTTKQKGVCWMRDLDGRVGEVQIDPTILLPYLVTGVSQHEKRSVS